MRVKWLRTAKNNLDAEMEYIAHDEHETAKKIFSYIMERVSSLEKYQNAGRQGRLFGTRELVIDRFPYIIPYRVRDDVVEILRVFHTSRKPPKEW